MEPGRGRTSCRVTNTVKQMFSVGLLLVAGCGSPPAAEEEVVRALRVMEIGDVAEFSGRSFPGRAAAFQEVNLSFRVGGPLITLPVKIGDQVSAGDVLARIDPRDFEVNVRNVVLTDDDSGRGARSSGSRGDRADEVRSRARRLRSGVLGSRHPRDGLPAHAGSPSA